MRRFRCGPRALMPALAGAVSALGGVALKLMDAFGNDSGAAFIAAHQVAP